MNDLDYLRLSKPARILHGLKSFFKNLPSRLLGGLKGLLMWIVGLFAGIAIGDKLFPTANSLGGAIGGLLGMGIPALVLYLTERRRKNDPRWTPQLVRVIPASALPDTRSEA